MLEVNKHYFLSGEKIYFSFHGTSALDIPKDLPLYFSLMQIKEDHQELVKAVKLKWDGQKVHGYVPLSKNLQSGNYLLSVFSDHSLTYDVPLHFVYLYIFNPMDTDDSNIQDIAIDQEMCLTYDNSSLTRNDDIKLSSDIRYNPKGDLYTFSGILRTDSSSRIPAHLSVSIIEKKYFDDKQLQFVYQTNNASLTRYLNRWTQFTESQKDSIRVTSNYLHGKLMIDDQPGAIRKVYYYAKKDSTVIFEYDITDHLGMFKFREPALQDVYSIKLFTFPEEKETCSFELLNPIYTDSIFNLNIPKYYLQKTRSFRDYALKKFLIDQSYLLQTYSETKSSDKFPVIFNTSQEIIMDNYIEFSTLPEIIREIVPLVSIKYKKGKYQIRIFDSRAKSFCCKDNPLIFVNDELFPDNGTVMNLPTNEIYSIEVLRTVDAIKQFGEVGINGFLKINMQSDTIVPNSEGNGVYSIILPGFQKETSKQAFHSGHDYPDFRNFLFWDGDIVSRSNEKFQFQFKASNLDTEYAIILRGMTDDGRMICEAMEFNPMIIE
jgi:hypothetical protein